MDEAAGGRLPRGGGGGDDPADPSGAADAVGQGRLAAGRVGGPAREPSHRAFPKVIEDWDIDRIITDFADAAERMKAAGLDGVEFECYGHLLDQFMSPLTNALPAPYGGSLENRARFAMEVLAACRKRVGENFLLGMRYTADEVEPGGIDAEEGIAIGKMFRDSGLVDFLNIIRGRIHTDPAMTDVIPIHGMKSAPHLDFAGRVRAEVGLPTFHAARIPDVATARYAVASGQLDMVGMTRAHMADPHIVQKIIEGREEDIRPCVGATYCLDRIYQGGMALCIHNPSTGREESMPHQIQPAATAQAGGRGGRRPGGAGGGTGGGRAWPFGCGVRGGGAGGRAGPALCADQAAGRVDWHYRLAHGAMRGVGGGVSVQHLG